MSTLLELRGIWKTYGARRRKPGVVAVRGVNLIVEAGTTLGLVGESGSGKSTLGRIITGLETADSGTVEFHAKDDGESSSSRSRNLRRDLQIVFQDPYSSLDPSWTIGSTLKEPLKNFGVCNRHDMDDTVEKLLDQVGLDAATANRLPSELSGGQRQRVAIARALAPNPRLIVADEAVSALDVSTQAEVVNLLNRLKRDLGLTYVFISHDMSVIRHFSDNVAVMQSGEIVENGTAEDVYTAPSHHYTRQLLAAAPSM